MTIQIVGYFCIMLAHGANCFRRAEQLLVCETVSCVLQELINSTVVFTSYEKPKEAVTQTLVFAVACRVTVISIFRWLNASVMCGGEE